MLSRRSLVRGLAAVLAAPAVPRAQIVEPIISLTNPALFLCSGQSNAVGNVPANQLPAYLTIADAGQQIWNGSAFVTLQNGVNNDVLGAGGTTWGPEAQFMWMFRQKFPSTTAYLLKYAIDTTPLEDDGTSQNWASTRVSPNNLYLLMKSKIPSALAAIAGTPKVTALLWMQGERDSQSINNPATCDTSSSPHYAADYQTNLASFVSGVHNGDWGDTNTMVLIGEVSPNNNALCTSVVDAAQSKIGFGRMFTRFIDTSNATRYPLLGDGIHFNATGLISLGTDMFNAWYNSNGPQ